MIRKLSQVSLRALEISLPWAVLGLLAFNTYVFFLQSPYYGFFVESNGRIGSIYAPSVLQSGDRVRQIGAVSWEDFSTRLRQPLFVQPRTGQVIPIVIERDGQTLALDYLYPAPTTAEIQDRLLNIWPLPYAFWLIGAITLLFARPKDLTWRLLILFSFLTALWISAGTLSNHRLFDSAIWLRVFMWLALPVYLHLHFVFPNPLFRLPKGVIVGAYGLALIAAVAQWFEWLPTGLYLLGFLVAIGSSLVLLASHYFAQVGERSALRVVLRAMVIAAVPSLALVLFAAATGISGPAGGGIVLLPLVPTAYFYAIYRYRLGGLEVRVNSGIAIYLFLVALGLTALVSVSLLEKVVTEPSQWIFICLGLMFGASVLSIFGFEHFRRFIEIRFLGIRVPPARLLEGYAAKASLILDLAYLLGQLQSEVLKSLLVRESALIEVKDQKLITLYAQGIEPTALLTQVDWLEQNQSRYLLKSLATNPDSLEPSQTDWIRLVLPLAIEGETTGYWLLGRRDPDDFYSADDISLLTTVAHQTAMALHTIAQAQRLHALYQNDIDEREIERANLARELHDQVLNELASLLRSAKQSADPVQLEGSFQRLAGSLRQTITGLRPAAIDFGLQLALSDLVDRVVGESVRPVVELVLDYGENTFQRYPPSVELHLYRIVQQALANALQKARPQRIKIHGHLRANQIALCVEDDGVGFDMSGDLDIARLVAQKHFGLANMYERAQLIQAEIQLRSGPGQGTQVELLWPSGLSKKIATFSVSV